MATGKHKSGLIVALVIIGAAGGGYYYYRHTNQYYANVIIKSGKSSNYPVLVKFDKKYLAAWAKGVKSGSETFTLDGSEYFTQGGKKKS